MAFSVAEAFVMLLVVSVVIGVGAPMITKQIKYNNLSDAQFTRVMRELERVNSRVLPSNAIMFFEGDCPTNWDDVSNSYAGRYVRIAGDNDICEENGMNPDGTCQQDRLRRTENLTPATLQGEASRRVWGVFPGDGTGMPLYTADGMYARFQRPPYNMPNGDIYEVLQSYVKLLKYYKILGGSFDYLEQDQVESFGFENDYEARYFWADTAGRFFNRAYATGAWRPNIRGYVVSLNPGGVTTTSSDNYLASRYVNSFDNSRQIPTDDENRPKTVVLRACKSP